MLVHIVLLKLKDNTPQNIKALHDKLVATAAQIEAVRQYDVGDNISESPRAYDIAVYSKFDTSEDLQFYLEHPALMELIEYIDQMTSARAVVDYYDAS